MPKSVQQSVPVQRIYKDGIWQVGNTRYSRTWLFTDINYRVAGEEEQEEMFTQYSDFLNILPSDAETQITINARRINQKEFDSEILMQMTGDNLDKYRKEYNDMLREKVSECNNLVLDKYITISVEKKKVSEARGYFNRIETDMSTYLDKLSSKIKPVPNRDRLRILHDFYRIGDEGDFEFDLKEAMRRGFDFRDQIAPDSMEFKSNYFMLNEKYGRALFLKDFSTFLKDDMIAELTEFSKNLMLSISIDPVPTDEAVKFVQNKILALETDITRWQRKQNENNNFNATIPYELEQTREEMREFMRDLTSRDQRMIYATITLIHMADSLDELDADTESLKAITQKNLCQMNIMRWQQESALNTTLPLGVKQIKASRTLTTEGVSVLMPFSTQEILDKNGIYYGQNAVSKNLIICDRKKLLNGNGFILGVSGSGKSMATKQNIVNLAMSTNDHIIIIDVEREYTELGRQLGAEIIEISANSKNRINALNMVEDYGDENPIALKSEFLMSVFEQLLGTGNLGPQAKSMIDRCMESVYRDYLKDFSGEPPTLKEFYAELQRQDEDLARELALAIELFVNGSLDIFAHQTNVNLNNRIIIFDIFELGKHLKTLGLLVMMDAIFNFIIQNKKKGIYTHLVIEEIYLFFANEYSANFLFELWKRLRKHGGLALGVTQNIEDCLRSPLARTMLGNSEFLLLLNQSASDRQELARLLHIPDTQLSHVTNSKAGEGLIKVGGSIVPFVNQFPTDTELYRLMTTRPSDKKGV